MIEDIEPKDEAIGYEPPTVVRLGSLAELTQGGSDVVSDGNGGAGDVGSG